MAEEPAERVAPSSQDVSPTVPTPTSAMAHLGRRAFAGGLALAGLGLLLTADGPPSPPGRALPLPVDGETARYLGALTDLSADEWTLLAVAAGLGDPGPGAARGAIARLPPGGVRGAALDWSYRAEAGRLGDLLARAQAVYARALPPDRARYFGDLLAAERARLAAGGQADYSAVAHLVTLINREQGLIARPELADFPLLREHARDPAAQPRGAATLLRERGERRAIAAAFRAETRRRLGTDARRTLAAPAGPLTLLADLGATGADRAATFQAIRADLPDLDDATLADQAVYFTAGDFLALEPPTPPGRWADRLPADQRAYAATNTLSPRLARAALLDPAHASRVLWPTLPECRALVAELRGL